MRILHVEDDNDFALLVRIALESSDGIVLERVDSLGAALDELQKRPFDAVLLDLGLQDSQGIDTLTAIRSAFGSLPVVVLTGWDDEGVRAKIRELGAVDCIVKSGRIVETACKAVERLRKPV